MNERSLPVVQIKKNGHVPSATVFAGAIKHPLSPAEAKRVRFITGLKNNYDRLKQTLQHFEHFAVVCELSTSTIENIRQANKSALDELAGILETKLRAYDQRIKEGS